MNNTYHVYFLYSNDNTLLYIGKSINIRNRLMNHFSKASLELESWKNEVNQENIIIYECTNDCDLDIYETYFINKYRPLYNKDKVFTKSLSFELPDLQPVIYNLLEEKSKYLKIPFQESLKKAISILSQETLSKQDKEELENIYNSIPIVKQAIETLGIKRINTLRFHKEKIEKELLLTNDDVIERIKTDLNSKIIKNDFYTMNACKSLLTDTFLNLDIYKKVKGKDILKYLNGKIINKRIDGILFQGCVFS